MKPARYTGCAHILLVLVLFSCAARCDAVHKRRAEALTPVLKQFAETCRTENTCDVGDVCNGGQCVPGVEGTTCVLSLSCVDGLECIQRVCTAPLTTTSRPTTASFATTESDSDETQPRVGTTCITDTSCPDQNTCEGGRCVRGTEGKECSLTASCVFGLICVSGECTDTSADPGDAEEPAADVPDNAEEPADVDRPNDGKTSRDETDQGFSSREYLDGMRILGDELRRKNRISIGTAFVTIFGQFFLICYKGSKVFRGPSKGSKFLGILTPVVKVLGGMIFSILLKIIALVGYAAVQRNNTASDSTDIDKFARENADKFVNVAKGLVLKNLIAQTVILLIADILFGIAAFHFVRKKDKNMRFMFWGAAVLTAAAAVATGLATARDIRIWDQGLRAGAFSLTSLMLLLSVLLALFFSGISRKQSPLTIIALLAIVVHVVFSFFIWFSSKGNDEFRGVIRDNMCITPARCDDIEEREVVDQVTNILKLAMLMFTSTNMAVAGTSFSGISYKRSVYLTEGTGEENPRGTSDEEQPPTSQY